MKSARINFGQPNSEYIAEVNDQGEAISFRNQDTDTEYIGGGGGLPDISAGDAGKVLAVSDELAAEWVSPALVQVLNQQTNNEVLSYNTLHTLLANHCLPYTDDTFTEDNEEIHTISLLAILSSDTNSYVAKFVGINANGQLVTNYYASNDPDAPMALD